MDERTTRSMNRQDARQLSLFGLKPTARIRKQPPGQLSIEIAEIAEAPKELNHDQYRT